MIILQIKISDRAVIGHGECQPPVFRHRHGIGSVAVPRERVKAKIWLYAQFIKSGCRDKERDHVDTSRRLDHTLRTSFFNEFAKRLVFDALDFHVSTDRRHECACQLMVDTMGRAGALSNSISRNSSIFSVHECAEHYAVQKPLFRPCRSFRVAT